MDNFTEDTATSSAANISFTTNDYISEMVSTTENSTSRSLSTMDILYVSIVSVTSFLSMAGCIVIIGVHVKWPHLINTGRSLLVQISIADLLTALGNLMGVMWLMFRDTDFLKRSNMYCHMQSALSVFGNIASNFWTTAMALSLFLVLVLNKPKALHTLWKPIWLLSWGVPTIVIAAAFAFDVFGYDPNITSASWCWLDWQTPNFLLWAFMTGKMWELSAYVLTVIFFSAVRITLRRHKATSANILRNQPRRDGVRDANTKLIFVPLVFIILRLFGTLRLLLGQAPPSITNSPYVTSWITPLQGFGDTAQGICNFVMDLVFSTQVRRRLCCTTVEPPAASTSTLRLSSVATISGPQGN